MREISFLLKRKILIRIHTFPSKTKSLPNPFHKKFPSPNPQSKKKRISYFKNNKRKKKLKSLKIKKKSIIPKWKK
jgi:hypothetical protein